MLCTVFLRRQFRDLPADEPEWDDAKGIEGHIDQYPERGNIAYHPANKSNPGSLLRRISKKAGIPNLLETLNFHGTAQTRKAWGW